MQELTCIAHILVNIEDIHVLQAPPCRHDNGLSIVAVVVCATTMRYTSLYCRELLPYQTFSQTGWAIIEEVTTSSLIWVLNISRQPHLAIEFNSH